MSGTDTPAAAQSPQLDRRQFLKATAGAAGIAAGVGAGSTMPGSPIGRAEALPCGGLCVGAAAAYGSGLVVGWLLRETEVIGSDDPPSGMTPESLKERVLSTTETRESTNASTFVDNQNILDGTEHVAWSDAKIAAIEKLNAEETQQACIDAGVAAIDSYETTIKSNLLKSWNESVNELNNLVTALEDHPDTSVSDVLGASGNGRTQDPLILNLSDRTHTLPDDSTIDMHRVGRQYDLDGTPVWDPADIGNYAEGRDERVHVTYSGQSVEYLGATPWNNVWTSIDSACQNVRDGIVTWVESVYSDVQAGELNTEDLLTPRELAELSSEEESAMNQALADLMALNIPVDLEREATISLSESGTTLSGMLGVSGETTLNSGDTIDPSADSLDYYLTYDVSQASGEWSAYDSGVDGGTVTFTSEPHPGVVYRITTNGSGGTASDTAGETAELTAEDFSETDSGGSWTADISDQVETAITEIQSVNFYSESEETQNETVLLDEPFTIEKFENTETGEEAESASYEQPTEPESDSNYITEEEWTAREERYNELIDKYEESQGGSGGITIPGIGDVSTGGMFGGVVAIAVVLFGAGKLSN